MINGSNDDFTGAAEWYYNGSMLLDRVLHKGHGPARVYPDGSYEWWQFGVLHREDGPAAEYVEGGRAWWQEGKRHRADGPAIECADGTYEWWVQGVRVSPGVVFHPRRWARFVQRNGLRVVKVCEYYLGDTPQFLTTYEYEEILSGLFADAVAVEGIVLPIPYLEEDFLLKVSPFPHMIEFGFGVDWERRSKEIFAAHKYLDSGITMASLGYSLRAIVKAANAFLTSLPVDFNHGEIIKARTEQGKARRRIGGTRLLLPRYKVFEDGRKEWRREDGMLHRVGGPAVEEANGGKKWYSHGRLHRVGAAALEYPNGFRTWYLQGERHRQDGPAVECANGSREWFFHGLRHREDGPAVEAADGVREWWLNGEKVDEAAVVAGRLIHYLDGSKLGRPYKAALDALPGR